MIMSASTKGFSILGLVVVLFSTNAQAFLDFEPQFITQSYENNGVMQEGQPLLPYEVDGDHYSICQEAFPEGAYIHNAESRYGQINWDIDTPLGSVDANIVYCDAEVDGYGRRQGHFAVGPDSSIYELRREGRYFSPIYDNYYY